MAKLWETAEDKELKSLWSRRFTARVIGKKLSRTRNSVISRVHRLKLERRAASPKPVKALSRVRKAIESIKSKPPIVSLPIKPKKVSKVHLSQINPSKCVWIDGEPKDGMCCGEQTINDVYCERHYIISRKG